jgi:hypothetical protein
MAMTKPTIDLAYLASLLAEPTPRMATTLRVGPGVLEILRHISTPSTDPTTGLFGARVVPDETYSAGEWRVFDQHGDEIGSGQFKPLAGMPAGTRVITSELLPPGTILAIAPTSLPPDHPDYLPLARRAAMIKGVTP